MKRRSILWLAAGTAGLGAAGFMAFGASGFVGKLFASGDAKAEIFTGSGDGIAINGYDPVGYFVAGKPVKGSAGFTKIWKGATWQFASAENLAAFTAEPDKYAPRYGGYCAYAVSQGSTASTVPEAWSIIDGRLYLNYSLGIKARFDTDTAGYIAAAETNWPSVLN